MERNRNLMPRSLLNFPGSFFSSTFPTLWEDMEDKMTQWFGTDTGISVSEDDQSVYVEAHLPGLTAEDLDISIDRNTLRIKGERKQETDDKDRKFYRRAQSTFFYQVDLPTQVEENTEQAQYQDGVLKIIFKKINKSNLKKINVKSQAPHSSNKESQNK